MWVEMSQRQPKSVNEDNVRVRERDYMDDDESAQRMMNAQYSSTSYHHGY